MMFWYLNSSTRFESFCAMNCTERNPNVSLYFKECTLRHLLKFALNSIVMVACV